MVPREGTPWSFPAMMNGAKDRTVAAEHGDEGGEERHGRDEQPGQPRGQRLLGVAEEQEGPGHLDGTEREDPPPLDERGAQHPLVQGERQEDEPCQQGAPGDDTRR